MNKLTVIDVFCGSGGFSEGFRQQGFTIKLGIDSWKPAIDTFNHNFGLKFEVKNVLDFRKSLKEIEALPDTDIIIGSPPCVSFSHSNLSGKADKSSGVLLTKIFLRIVAVKKFKKGSKLKAWYMENVTNSTNYLNDYYTFKDLGLTKWAQQNGHSPNKKAIILEGNQSFINSADYGSTQKRTRVISGEIVRKRGKVLKKGRFSVPPKTHRDSRTEGEQPFHKTLNIIKNGLPKPNQTKTNKTVLDPQYDGLRLKASELSDHFYDTGLYACEWKQSEHYKTNHPYMGNMSFPENEDRPSRTITATKGQVVIPASVRRKLGIKTGTRIQVEVDEANAQIILTPITREYIKSMAGKFRGLPLLEGLIRERKLDKEREDRKFDNIKSK